MMALYSRSVARAATLTALGALLGGGFCAGEGPPCGSDAFDCAEGGTLQSATCDDPTGLDVELIRTEWNDSTPTNTALVDGDPIEWEVGFQGGQHLFLDVQITDAQARAQELELTATLEGADGTLGSRTVVFDAYLDDGEQIFRNVLVLLSVGPTGEVTLGVTVRDGCGRGASDSVTGPALVVDSE